MRQKLIAVVGVCVRVRWLGGPPHSRVVGADKSWNGVTEWAYGVTPWFEAGFTRRSEVLYGATFEFSINQKAGTNIAKIEAGVGFGLTSATDNVTGKLLLIKDLN